MKIEFDKDDLIVMFSEHLERKGISVKHKDLDVTVKSGRRHNPGSVTATVILTDKKPTEEHTLGEVFE